MYLQKKKRKMALKRKYIRNGDTSSRNKSSFPIQILNFSLSHLLLVYYHDTMNDSGTDMIPLKSQARSREQSEKIEKVFKHGLIHCQRIFLEPVQGGIRKRRTLRRRSAARVGVTRSIIPGSHSARLSLKAGLAKSFAATNLP